MSVLKDEKLQFGSYLQIIGEFSEKYAKQEINRVLTTLFIGASFFINNSYFIEDLRICKNLRNEKIFSEKLLQAGEGIGYVSQI